LDHPTRGIQNAIGLENWHGWEEGNKNPRRNGTEESAKQTDAGRPVAARKDCLSRPPWSNANGVGNGTRGGGADGEARRAFCPSRVWRFGRRLEALQGLFANLRASRTWRLSSCNTGLPIAPV